MTQYSPESIRAARLLTNRLVSLDAKPLAAREFWDLLGRLDPADLLHEDPSRIAELTGSSEEEGLRLRALLDASTALGFEEERLLDGGISVISAIDERFPAGLRQRLGTACPPFLIVAGPSEWLDRPGLGVVGSRDADHSALETARDAASMAVQEGWPVVSGLARGVDQIAMAGALDADGVVIGVPAEGILRASRDAEIRGRVHEGKLCIASPYAPDAPFRAGNAMGRNKIIYALSQVTFVVASDEDSGGTWAGAKEALSRQFAPVGVWMGAGAKSGNEALVRRGATAITDLSQLFDAEVAVVPPLQDSLF